MQLPSPESRPYERLIVDIEKGDVKIPRFQRNFVWPLKDSAKLLDSIIKGYPIGTFIFWVTKDSLGSVRNIGNLELPKHKKGESVAYVLDGQQRLTSWFATVKGFKIERESGREEDFSKIYIDLTASESDAIVTTEVQEEQIDKTLISVKKLLSGGITTFDNLSKEYRQKLDNYKSIITKYTFSVIEVRDASIDIATDIFARINVRGKKLTVFEIMVARTFDEDENFDLLREYEEFSKELDSRNYDTISNQSILQLVALMLGSDCKSKTILELDRKSFIKIWPNAVDSMNEAIDHFRDIMQIPVSKLLPYAALIVPFAYFFYKVKRADMTDGQQSKLHDFFWRCALAGRYSSAAESKLAQDIGRMNDIVNDKLPDYDWGIDISPNFIIKNGDFNAGRSFVKAILCIMAHEIPRSFKNHKHRVNIRNDALKQANSKNYHHYFPKGFIKNSGEAYKYDVNNIVNITIVDETLNKGKIKAKAPSKYMEEFKNANPNIADTMRTHLINDLNEFGIWGDDYDKFIEKRAEAISKELKNRIIPNHVDDSGQLANSDDRDDVYESEEE